MQSHHKKSFAAEQLARRKKTNPVVWVIIGLIAVILVAGGYMIYHRSVSLKQAATKTHQIKSIAVLPFEDLSPEQNQDYFCKGIAEEILNMLAHVGGIRVIASTTSFSLKDREKPVFEICKQQDIQSVLEGSIRKEGNQVRITAQLIKVADESHLWSNQYDRELKSTFAIQSEIAEAVVQELKGAVLERERVAIENRQTEDFEAYDYYLLGRSYFNKQTPDDWVKALDYFKKAVETDPEYALAYAGIADVQFYSVYLGHSDRDEQHTSWKEAANKALELDDTLAETNASYARMTLYVDSDAAASEHYFKRALEINPGYALAHWWYHDTLFGKGRFDEAIAEMKKAQELDPLSIRLYTLLGWNYSLLGRYDEAMEQFEKAKKIDPDSRYIYWRLSQYHEYQGNYAEAVKARIKVLELDDRRPETDGQLGYLYAMAGDRERATEIQDNLEKQTPVPLFDLAKIHIAFGERGKAEQVLNDLIERNKKEHVPAEEIAEIYVRLGNIDSTWKWVEKAIEKNIWAIELLPEWKPMRSYPKYIAMKKKMGWRE